MSESGRSPPPPPPPPPSLSSLQVSKSNSTSSSKKMSPLELQKPVTKSVKTFQDQVREACQRLSPVSELQIESTEPRRHHFVYCSSRHTQGLLQDGPQCGLVALAMAVTALSPSGSIETSKILDMARSKGVTKHGEMFSTMALAELATVIFSMTKTTQDITAVVESSDILNNPFELMNFFIANEKNLLLVPYDSDFNQQPCQKQGLRAHWAILLGFALTVPVDEKFPGGDGERIGENISILKNESANIELLTKGRPFELKVMARQGKSLRLFLFDPKTLHQSNRNLKTWEPSEDDERHFVIPEGGISKGLRAKLVKLTPKA